MMDDTKIMDSKFTLEIQQIRDALKEEKASRQARVKENFDTVSGKSHLVIGPLLMNKVPITFSTVTMKLMQCFFYCVDQNKS